MLTRRSFVLSMPAPLFAGRAKLDSKQRVDRALRGEDVDRIPFTFWHHFGLEKYPASKHAQATLDFHRKFRTDLVKVMSDYPYPKPPGKWHELRVEDNPFPEEIQALEIIRDGLADNAYFLETIFNPWNVAEKLSSKDVVLRLKAERPQALLDALEVIAESQVRHAKKAVATGAAGIFLAVANAQDGILTEADYAKFSEPFDRMILQAVDTAPLNTLHLHGDKVYLQRFFKGWPVAAINYSSHSTGVGITEVRRQYSGLLLAGLDEVNFRKLSPAALRNQWHTAVEQAGKRLVLAPGCSIPNDTADIEMQRLLKVIGA